MSGGSDPTISVYDAQAHAYARRNATLYELPDAEAFAAMVPPGGKILDLGCGPGQYAAWYASKGFEVEAWDASSEMVALSARHEGLKARQARYEDLAATQEFDGIWANFSLLHAPRTALPDLLARIHRALKPGAVFHIAMKLGEGGGPDKLDRFYSYYSEAELRGLLEAAGLTVLSRRLFSGEGLDGTAGAYITLLCHG